MKQNEVEMVDLDVPAHIERYRRDPYPLRGVAGRDQKA